MANRLALLFLLPFFFATFLWGTPLPKVLSTQNTASSLLIKFDRDIKKEEFKFLHLSNQDGYRKNIYDIKGALTSKAIDISMEGGVECKIAQFDNKTVRVVFLSKDKFYTSSRNISGDTIEFKLTFSGDTQPGSPLTKDEPEPPKTVKINDELVLQKKGDTTVIKQTNKKIEEKEEAAPQKGEVLTLRNKTVILDPGHGGHDCGAYGANKVCEKVIVLDIAKMVAAELKKMGYKVLLTRSTDKFIKLMDRTRFANNKNGDIFVSIHANAVPKTSSKELNGIETYFLSMARSDRAKNVAALENRDDLESMNYFAKETTLGILNNPRMVASNKLAIDLQYGMLKSAKNMYDDVIDGGVREGPFWVLLGAVMPAALVEIGYMSNPEESKRLATKKYQREIAKGIAEGIEAYFRKNS